MEADAAAVPRLAGSNRRSNPGPTPTTAQSVTYKNWTAYRVATIQDQAQTWGYNAAYIDELGLGALTNTTSAPLGTIGVIDPRTGAVWTKLDWMDEMSDYLTRITAAVDLPVWVNGLATNTRFYDPEGPTSRLLAADGAAAEQYVRAPTLPLNKWPTEAFWDAERRMTVEAGSKLMSLTKTWVDGSQALKDQWHRFALTTFMISAAGGARFYFTNQRATTVTPFHPYWAHSVLLGPATAEATTPSPRAPARTRSRRAPATTR